MADIFLSYARDDDEPFVKRLYEDLTARGFEVWWDRVSMPSRALTFAQEIRDAIDAADRLILVVGPAAVRSEYVRAEWQYALEACKVVTPILCIGDYELLPEGLAKLHCPDFRETRPYDDALAELLRILAEPVLPLGKLHDVPSLPPHFLPRPEEMPPLAETVLADVERPVVITSARQTTTLQGMGGVGKSVLAAAFAHACETRRAFTDGVIWLTIGQQPDLARSLALIGQAFNDVPQYYLDLQSSKARLGQVLADKVCLLVLDDIWDVAHAEPFVNALGSRCKLLITTRDGGLATALGAQEHRLDVLGDEAARRLLADWSDLSVEALPSEARAVADECGNLPFALALCGAVARDGTPWADLLDALREADLTFIEKQFPNYPYPDVLKSLKVSVDVLAGTDPAGAKRYEELAVFPADEAVPEAAVMTLWLHTDGLNERKARKLLTTLERKALLRLEGEAPQRRVSLHDLQHDYLRAVQDDLTDLHDKLLAAYCQRCVDGWPSGPNDGYFFQHLAYHLVEAQRVEDLHRLLALETSEQRNAWYEAKEAHDDAAGYVADVARAWQCAEEVYAPADSTYAGQSIGFQCRYALIIASLNSLAKNLPPALLTTLVERGVWTPVKGLAYARQVPDSEQRVKALGGLAPYLPEPLKGEALREALAATQQIEFEWSWGKALAGLAPRLPEPLLWEALAAAQQIEKEWGRAEALVGLAPRLAELGYSKEALAAVQQITYADSRARALIGLAPHLPEPLRSETLQEALAAVQQIVDQRDRAEALAGLAPHLSEPLLREALAAAQQIEEEWNLAKALVGLAPRLAELGYSEEALAAVQAITFLPVYKEAREEALVGLAPHLPEPLKDETFGEAVAAAQQIRFADDRAGALARLAPHLPEPLKGEILREAVAAAQQIRSEGSRAGALARLAPHLPEPLKGEILQEALAVVQQIWWRGYGRESTLMAKLVPHLPEPLLHGALATAQQIADGQARAEALVGLTPHLSEPLLREALAAAQQIEEEWDRAKALVGLAPRLAELGYSKEALAAVRQITYAESRAKALIGLAPHLPEPLKSETLQEALAAVQQIVNQGDRAYALAGLAPHLSEPLLREALAAAQQMYEGTLARLIPHLPGPLLRGALATAQQIADEEARARALAGLAPHLSEPLLREALAATREIEDEYYREKALAGLAPRLAELGYLNEALAAARQIAHETYRARALTGLAPHLSEPLKSEALREALSVAQQIRFDESRAESLVLLAPHLTEPLLREALAAVQGITNKQLWEKTLAGLVPRLAELGYPGEAMAIVQQKTSRIYEPHRASALARLAPHLSEELLGEALTAAREIAWKDHRAQALRGLAPHLAALPCLVLDHLWLELQDGDNLLHAQARRTRKDLLADLRALTPVIAALGGPEAVAELLRAIQDVAHWWP